MTEDRSSLRVLVVDDEPVVAETLVLILKGAGIKAKAAYSGPEAMKLSADFDPDALISDVMLIGMTGIELAIEIATRSPRCRILLFSGCASAFDLKSAEEAGFHFPMLSKPVHPQVLLDWLAEVPVSKQLAPWN